MKVIFAKQDGTSYEQEITKVTCGNGYYLYFYNNWEHPLIIYEEANTINLQR